MIDGPAVDKLDRAWLWYQTTRDLSRRMARLGEEHWADLPWNGKLQDDPLFSDLEAPQVEKMARDVLEGLGEIAVLLLFSAFEATVRDRVIADVAADIAAVRHPASVKAMNALNRSVDRGNFDRVLNDCEGLDAALVEGVRRVRDYRNWVAHGRRGDRTADVTPEDAYQLLRQILVRLDRPA